MQSHLLSTYLLSYWCSVEEVTALLRCSSVLHIFFFCTLRVMGLTLKSLVDFEWILVQNERHRSCFSLLLMDTFFSQHHLLRK
jgi:hypothetical protein